MNSAKSEIMRQFGECGQGFTLEEAFKLINHEVIRKQENPPSQSIEHVGVISGLLALNDEVELVIRFLDSIELFTKEAFTASLKTIT